MSATHRIPPTTVKMGTVLDLVIKVDPETLLTIKEWRGWLLTCGENAFELEPGRARLFLFPAGDDKRAPSKDYDAAARAYERWHKRDAARVDAYKVPDEFTHLQGRVLRIGYSSDKWAQRGRRTAYEHDFTEDGGKPPLLYTDTRSVERARGAVIVGGDMWISEEGIA